MKSNGKCMIIAASVMVTFATTDLTYAEVGSLRSSNSVESSFEAYEYNPNYRYFYLGLDANPYAVIGIWKDYVFNEGIEWTEVDPNSTQFKNVIDRIERFPENSSAFGAQIRNNNGEMIGSYYSGQSAGVVIEKAQRSVAIYVQLPGSDIRSGA